MATLKNTVIDSTGSIRLPVGTTAQRPVSPVLGMMRYNTEEEAVEIYDSEDWAVLGSSGGGLYSFTTATFTPGSQTGRIGPSLTQARNGLSGTGTETWKNNIDFYDMPSLQGYQLWTVPSEGLYRFVVTGASRGAANTEGASARITADLLLSTGQKLWIVCGQQATGHSEVGSGGSWVVLSNSGAVAGSTPLLVAGGAGDYSFYGSETSFQTGQQFSNAQTTNNLNASVLDVAGPQNPITGNGGTVFTNAPGTSGFVTGGGGFNSDGAFFSGGNTQSHGLSFFNGLFGGIYQSNVFDTTTTNGGGFGGGSARAGGFGTGGGGGYTGGAAAGGDSPNLRRSTGGSSFVAASATNVTRELSGPSAPSAAAVQGSVQITLL